MPATPPPAIRTCIGCEARAPSASTRLALRHRDQAIVRIQPHRDGRRRGDSRERAAPHRDRRRRYRGPRGAARAPRPGRGPGSHHARRSRARLHLQAARRRGAVHPPAGRAPGAGAGRRASRAPSSSRLRSWPSRPRSTQSSLRTARGWSTRRSSSASALVRSRPTATPTTFRLSGEPMGIDELVPPGGNGGSQRVALVVPPGATWPLPIYELALMARRRADESGRHDLEYMVVTPEDAPLALFGSVAERCRRRGAARAAHRGRDRRLRARGRRRRADRSPRATGRWTPTT